MKIQFLMITISLGFIFGISEALTKDALIPVVKINGDGYVYLNDLITSCSIEGSFDIITQKGKLYYKSHYAVYNVSFSLLVIDGRLFRSGGEIIRNAGAVMIPLDATVALMGSFFRELTPIVERDKITLKHSEGVGPRQEDKKTFVEKKNPERIAFIMIDPGHGGKDPGAVSKGGMMEKTVNLGVGINLENELKKRFPEMRILMTRRGDQFIELAQRTRLVNRLLKKNSNGIFLSIHVNATLAPVISGVETYYLSQNPSNEDARNTAALENNVIVLEQGGTNGQAYNDIDYIEATMLTTQIQKESSLLAECIQNGMLQTIRASKSRGVKNADFFVLRGVLMPAVLIEVGFITNKREADMLKDRGYQKKIASGIADGVAVFLKKYNALIE